MQVGTNQLHSCGAVDIRQGIIARVALPQRTRIVRVVSAPRPVFWIKLVLDKPFDPRSSGDGVAINVRCSKTATKAVLVLAALATVTSSWAPPLQTVLGDVPALAEIQRRGD
jgi:hypothetical protein